MTFKPWLPPDWTAIAFRLKWHGNQLSVSASHTAATFLLSAPAGSRETILVHGHEVALPANTDVVVDLDKVRG
jgi:kojibiose phosphorylase